MEEYSVTQFKNAALRLIAQVAESKEPCLITKRGKAIASLVPWVARTTNKPGRLKGSIVHEGDILNPIATDDWAALQ